MHVTIGICMRTLSVFLGMYLWMWNYVVCVYAYVRPNSGFLVCSGHRPVVACIIYYSLISSCPPSMFYSLLPDFIFSFSSFPPLSLHAIVNVTKDPG